MKEIEKEILNENCNIYAENTFNKISDKIELKPVYFSDRFCMEIDTIEDLILIKALMK